MRAWDDPLWLALKRAKGEPTFGGRPWRGKPHSDQTRARMCLSQTRRRAREIEGKIAEGDAAASRLKRRLALWVWVWDEAAMPGR